MRKLFIVLALCGVSILNAQQLNVASYNVRNSNPNDAKAGNGWEQRCPVLTQLITFHDFDIFGAQEVKHNQLEDMLNALPQYSYIGVGRDLLDVCTTSRFSYFSINEIALSAPKST